MYLQRRINNIKSYVKNRKRYPNVRDIANNNDDGI